MNRINYYSKIWGVSILRISPTYLAYLRLKYCLSDLKDVSGKIIDIGCGGGGFTKAVKFYRPDLVIYGVDISNKAICKAKKNPQGIEFQVADIYNLPFKDSYFDGAILTDVLEHLENPAQALIEVKRTLKPGGLFHLFVPLEGEFFTLYFFLDKLGWKAKENLAGHIQRFTWKKLENFFKNSQFQVLKKRYSGHLFGQIVDTGFYTLASILKLRLETGLEEHLQRKSIIFRFFKNFLTFLVNYESYYLAKIPGSGMHILVRKKNK